MITRFDKGITSSDQSVYLQSCSNPLYCRSFSVSRNFIEGFFWKVNVKVQGKECESCKGKRESKGEFKRRIRKESSKGEFEGEIQEKIETE